MALQPSVTFTSILFLSVAIIFSCSFDKIPDSNLLREARLVVAVDYRISVESMVERHMDVRMAQPELVAVTSKPVPRDSLLQAWTVVKVPSSRV